MIKKTGFYIILAICVVILSALTVRSAVQQIAGLAVAASTYKWNNVKDASQGDGLANGILSIAPYLYNGATFDAARGTTANGLDVDVTRLNDGGNSITVDGTVTTLPPTAGNLFYAIKKSISATAITNEIIGTGNGSTTSFSGTLANILDVRSTISIAYTIGTTGYTATDDGAGAITGTNVSSGSINYTTGVWSMIFSTAPDNGSDILANYTYQTSTNFNFGFTSKKIVIETSGSNTGDMCVDWVGGTAECPQSNVAGDDLISGGASIVLDNYAVSSISATTKSTTAQIIHVRAYN